jgi:membrane protein involved in colicin uptake
MGSSGKSSGGGYQGPTESQLAARRAEERAEAARQRREARLEALEDARRQQERDEAAANKAKLDEAEALAAREAKEEMVGMEAEGQEEQDMGQQQDIMGSGDRYGKEARPGATKEQRPTKPKKRPGTSGGGK